MKAFLGQLETGTGITGLDLTGMPTISSTGDLQADRATDESAIYGDLTKNLARNKATDLEAQKQELAERGIPYTPGDTTSAYGKAIQGVTDQYTKLDEDAQNQARIQSTQDMATTEGTQANAQNAFLTQALAKANYPLNALNTLSGSSQLQTLLQSILGTHSVDTSADTSKAVAGINAGSASDTANINAIASLAKKSTPIITT